MKVPIDHHVKISAKITPQIEKLSAPLHKVLHIPIALPIKQHIQIDTKITIPLRNLIAAQFAAMSQRRRPQ
jgi:hypothetical protein